MPQTTPVFEQDDYFKIDPEPHIMGNIDAVKHFPGVQMWWRAVEGAKNALFDRLPDHALARLNLEDWEREKDTAPERLLQAMDKYGVDIACLLPESMMDTTGYTTRWCNNGDMAKAVDANPHRFMYQPNISPIKHKGIDNTIWELEYWSKERGAKIFKFYPPEDTYINDDALWPFYKKAEELGIVLDIHTGFSWVPPGKSKYSVPILIDDVARDFPNLKINAFHMGYPHCDDLNMIAMGHPNVHVCLSLLVPWALNAPRKFAKIIGEAMRFVGTDRIIWGTDYAGFGVQVGTAVLGMREFQIPEDMQRDYGYPAITEDDRRKMFGGNLGRLLGVDTSVRRIDPK